MFVGTGCHFLAIPSYDRKSAQGAFPALKRLYVGDLCLLYERKPPALPA